MPPGAVGESGSGGFPGRDDWEVDVGLERLVDVVGEGVQLDMGDDLQHLRVAVAGGLHETTSASATWPRSRTSLAASAKYEQLQFDAPPCD